tara:strand:+ start:204 stop:449 length:246 start_codon:yes stop_codon:yes gene_type:complete
MIINAKLKCDKDHIPYRVFINDELITERFYSISSLDTVSNDLQVSLKDSENYNIKIENLSDTEVHLVDYTIVAEEVQNEDT